MEDQETRIGYPRTAYEFFLKLYCKKRGTFIYKGRNTSLAAIKAWVTLSEDEKNKITEKFNECKMKHMAMHLEKMEPYMKKKPTQRFQPVHFIKCKTLVNNECSVQGITQIEDGNIDKDINTNNINMTSLTELNIQEQHNSTKSEYIEEYEVPVISEPSPPNIRNSVDLFNIIKNKEESNSEWSALSKAEKMRYRKAVYQLKKDYIQNYKIYLESLPSKELFKYYPKFDKNV